MGRRPIDHLTDPHREYLAAVIELTRGPCGPPTRHAVRHHMGKFDVHRGWDSSTLNCLIRNGYLIRAPGRNSPLVPIRDCEGRRLRLLLVVEVDDDG